MGDKCIRWKRRLPGIRKNNHVSWRKIENISQTAKKAESPKNLKDLLKLITPPKGVKRKGEKTAVPVDEGEELFDCDGEELNHEPLLESDDSDQDDEENGDPANEGEKSDRESTKHHCNACFISQHR